MTTKRTTTMMMRLPPPESEPPPPEAGAGAGAGAGASRDARDDLERLRAARRVMLRRTRETLDECLVAVGVLERRGGG